MAGARVQPEDIQVGGVLAGRFRVLERLGAGSTAVVYKVQDQLVNDVVALKVLRPLGAEDSNIIARFKRELATARKLSHPNVVTLYDLGTYEGLYYISMEYVEGTSLAERLAESGPLSLPDFLGLCDELCKALSWIHSRNFVHRDIKPSNVMYTSTGILKLMDLGIAKELAADQMHSTRTGTPGYASPEQEAGDPLGPASDIYSTGAMFFELLTGSRPPGRGDSSYPEAIRHAAPELPGIIAKCMQRLPANRYRTVDELHQATAKMRREYSAVTPGHASIADKMTDEPGNLKELLPLFLQTVKRVTDIHTAGRYHLELSPRNILINSAGGVEIESYDAPRSQTSTIGPSQVKYLAPELFSDVHDSGSHSCAAQDTYVMGFVFYEMVCGRREFNREFPGAIDGDRFWLTWHGDPRKTLQPLGEIVPKCPKALATLLQQMTTKDRAGRPANLDQVADALLQLHLSTEDTAPILTPTGKPPVESTPSTPPPPYPSPDPSSNPFPNPSPYANSSSYPPAYPIAHPVPTDNSSGGKSWLVLLGRVAAIVLSLAVLVGGAVYVAHERNRPPASFRLEANELVVLDPHGSELWRKKLDAPVDPDPHAGDEVGAPSTRAWFGDLDGDGHTETLFLYSPKDARHLSSLICLSDRGEERWRFVPGRTVSSRKRAFPPPYRIAEFLVAPVGPKHSPAVIVSSVHFQDYPTQVVLLSPQGEMTGEYWHSGRLNRIATADLDRDGVPEIYLGGVSAARNSATLVALTPDRFAGASSEGAADFQLDGLPRARERGRVFFPRSCMNQKHEASNRVSALRVDKDFISVSVLELLTGPKPVLTYRLDRDLSLVDLTLSPQLPQTHKQMEKTGEIDHPFTPAEEAALRAIVVVRP